MRYLEHLRKTMMAKDIFDKPLKFLFNNKSGNTHLYNIIVLVRRIHSSIIHNVQCWCMFCDPAVFLWMTMTIIIMLVFHLFVIVVVKILGNSHLNVPGVNEMEMQLFVSVLVILYALNNLEEFQKVVSF